MDSWVWWPTVILIGAAVGSFVNVVVYRLPQGMSLWSPPSRCPHCQTTLSQRDNIPVLGWWLLGGRCRYCQGAISWRYPAVETLCLLLYGLAFVLVGWQPPLLLAWVLLAWLLALALIDWDTGYLPEPLTQGGLVVATALQGILGWVQAGPEGAVQHLLDGIVAAVVGIWLLEGMRWLWLWLRGKEALGLGDGKFLAGIGMFLGWWPGVILTVILAAGIGLLVWLGLWLLKKTTLSRPIPFGPCLAAAALLTYASGPWLVQRYWHWLLGY
ncbi:MAG: prepilin peptidase [Thermostichales cyanobacterium SRBZ-1_bins_19]